LFDAKSTLSKGEPIVIDSSLLSLAVPQPDRNNIGTTTAIRYLNVECNIVEFLTNMKLVGLAIKGYC
jgi:hypothetical protein